MSIYFRTSALELFGSCSHQLPRPLSELLGVEFGLFGATQLIYQAKHLSTTHKLATRRDSGSTKTTEPENDL
jgi:hypothetical protein